MLRVRPVSQEEAKQSVGERLLTAVPALQSWMLMLLAWVLRTTVAIRRVIAVDPKS